MGELQRKIAVFVCNDLTGLLILNRAVPVIKNAGYDPIIYNSGDIHNRRLKAPTPSTIKFFNNQIVKDITTVLESHPATKAKNLTCRQLAEFHDIEYREIVNVNDPSFIHEVESNEYICGAIAVRFLQVFEKSIIEVFEKKGFIWNLHSGLLPKYRGLLTPYRAIANKEKTYGLTLHHLTCGIDEGNTILMGELPLNYSRPILDLYMDTVPVAAEMLSLALNRYRKDGIVPSIVQESYLSDYYTNPTEKEFFEFMRQGIFYADAYAMPEKLADLFGGEDLNQRILLKNALSSAIHNYMPPTDIQKIRA